MKCVQRHFEEHREDCLLGQQYGSFLPEEEVKSAQAKAAASLSRSKPKETKSFSGPIGQNKDNGDSLNIPKKAASFSAVTTGPKRSKSVGRKKGKSGAKDIKEGVVEDDGDVQSNRVEKTAKVPKKDKSNRDKSKGKEPEPDCSQAALQGSSPSQNVGSGDEQSKPVEKTDMVPKKKKSTRDKSKSEDLAPDSQATLQGSSPTQNAASGDSQSNRVEKTDKIPKKENSSRDKSIGQDPEPRVSVDPSTGHGEGSCPTCLGSTLRRGRRTIGGIQSYKTDRNFATLFFLSSFE